MKIDKTKAQELFVRGSGNVSARIQFLKEITLFKRVDELILMTLANSLKIQTYSYGEFIVREGERPKGMYIITGGQAITCA